MRRLISIALLVAVAATLMGCQGGCGTPNATLHWPITFGRTTSTPTQAIQVPMQPAYAVQAAPVQYVAPAAPQVAPCVPQYQPPAAAIGYCK